MRVAVYAICLNELLHVRRFLDSCAGADLVAVADTGSSDGTPEALRAGGAAVHTIGVRPWRFDTARNAALALLPADIDVCISLDLDEVLNPGWRAALDVLWTPQTTRAGYLYAWSHTKAGAPDVQFWSDKIHARHGYRWRHPCHEALYPDRIEERKIYLHDLRVDHWPDNSKSRSQYLPLLEAAVREEPQSTRDAYYLGREYFALRRFEAAEAELKRYLNLPGATWLEQNGSCMGMIAKCRDALGDGDGALRWFQSAARMAPERRDGWWELTHALFKRKMWVECREAADRTLALPDTPTASANVARGGRPEPADLASLAAWRLGDKTAALGYAKSAAARNPDDPRLSSNVRAIERALAHRSAS